MSSSTADYDYLFKIILIGDCGVGKTQIRNRYTHGEFDSSSKSTIGVEFAFKTHEIDGKCVKGQIWDTSGEERYRAITSAYFRGSIGAMLVFDITKYNTFINLENWVLQLKQYGEPNMFVCIVGNKSDLDNRQVTTGEAAEYAKKLGYFYMETSALNGSNVSEAFEKVIESIFDAVEALKKEKKRITPSELPGDSKTVQLDQQSPKGINLNSSGCSCNW